MKNNRRNSTLVFCLLISSLTIAGTKRQNYHPVPQGSIGNPIQTSSISIVPFYNEDFANGIPATWQTLDSAGNGLNWKYTTTGSHDGNSLSSSGTTALNGYMIYDSDSAGGAHGIDKADLISGMIDCSTHPNVHLNFNEFLVYYNDTALVYISTDSINWTQVHNSSAGLTQYGQTSNPNNVDVDITSLAGGQDSVWIRFSYHADYSFYWMIDDVILHEVAQQDAALSSITSPGSSCTLLSDSESVSVAIYNDGGTTISSCFVTYIVDGGTPVTDTVNASIAVASTYSYTFSTSADFSAPGTHTISAYVKLPGDTNTTNDSAHATMFNGPHVVDQVYNYQIGFELNEDLSTFGFDDGNLDTVTWSLSTNYPNTGSMSLVLQSATADDWVFTPCLDLDSGETYALSYYGRRLSTSFQASLQIAIGQAQNPSGMGQIILANAPFAPVFYQQDINLFSVPVSGTYYIGFEVSSIDSAVGFALDDINVYSNNGNGIKENLSDKFIVYPNPSNGVVYIDSKLQSQNGFKVDVMNALGSIVKSDNSQILSNYSIDMSGLASGIYIIRIISENGISTHKIMLK
jgi:hypothetical protein